MDRRRFMKVAGIAGMSLMAPVALRDREARAGAGTYKGPFWIMMNAQGGWDATMLTDPKGGTSGNAMSVDQAYTPGMIGKAGNIEYAPLSYSTGGVVVQTAQAFFEAHYQRLCVINGVDTQTNNHDAGTCTTWSGQLLSGFPSLAAMIATAATADLPIPLSYISNGGYDDTGGLCSLTRVGDPTALEKLAFPNQADPTNPTTDTFFTNNTASRIQAAQAGRIAALTAKATLPTTAGSMNSLYLARQTTGGLSLLGNALKSTTLVTTNDIPNLNGVQGLNDLQGLMQQAQLALVAFKAGVAVSANLNYGGFDTHSNNDTQQTRQLMIYLCGLDYLFKQIDAMGLTDQVYVVCGSDFSRTPYYNAGNGKDHWNITSQMFAGPKIEGNRVLGGTDAGFVSIPVDPSTLAQAPMTGERINTTHVHHALRKLAGLSGTPLDTEYGLPGDQLPLFG